MKTQVGIIGIILKINKVMSHLINDEISENLFEMFIEAGYTDEEAEQLVLEAINAKGL